MVGVVERDGVVRGGIRPTETVGIGPGDEGGDRRETEDGVVPNPGSERTSERRREETGDLVLNRQWE